MIVSGARGSFLRRATSALGALALVFVAACVVSAPASASGRSIEASPSGVPNGVLSGVSCPTAKTCFAVGHYVDEGGVQRPVAEVRKGGVWARRRTPSLARKGALIGVSCTSARACTAVGDYVDSSGAEVAVAERWNGTAWSIQSTPPIAGASSSVLNDVSCASASACTAVGQYVDGSGTGQPLAEAWDGTAWSAQTITNPSSGIGLSRISCSAPNACTALAGGTTVERWNGSTWTSQSVAIPGGATSTQIDAVACTGANFCEAVGDWSEFRFLPPGCNPFNPHDHCTLVRRGGTLTEQWNGSGWNVQSTPSQAAGYGSPGLSAVSCASATACMAVGSNLAEQWNGSTWGGRPGAGLLTQVSCKSASDCTAIGGILAQLWNGSDWTAQPTAQLPPGPDNSITGTVTDSATRAPLPGICVQAYGSSGGVVASSQTESNGTYTISALPNGSYRVGFSAGCGADYYVTQYYDDKPTLDGADLITVMHGTTTSGINAAMVLEGQITGTVTDSTTGAPLAGICLNIFDSSGGVYADLSTNADGVYTTIPLPAGSYRIGFNCGGNNLSYAPQYYHGEATLASADPVTVTDGNKTAGINAALVAQGGPGPAADSIYWGNWGNGSISYSELNNPGGGGQFNIAGTIAPEPWGAAIDPATNKIYWANNGDNTISFASLNGGGGGELSTTGATVAYPTGLAIDPATNKIYWANENNSISFANLNDTGHGGQLDTTGAVLDNPTGLTIDPARNKVYWTNFFDNTVGFANLNDTGHGGQLNTTGAALDSPFGLAIDPANQKLYIADSTGSLSFASLNGTGGGQLNLTGAAPDRPQGVAVDPSANKIYWGDYFSISFASLDDTGGGQLNTSGATLEQAMFPVILKAPTGTARPAILGGSTQGSVLTCSKGQWAPDLLGSFLYQSPERYSYAWTLNGTTIEGANSPSIAAQSSGLYSCNVTATNHAGSSTQVSAAHNIS